MQYWGRRSLAWLMTVINAKEVAGAWTAGPYARSVRGRNSATSHEGVERAKESYPQA